MAKIRLCNTADVAEGEPVSVNLKGFQPLAVYDVDGEYFVTSNMCTHGRALLTDGYQEGDVIECPLHGGAFNIKTGEPEVFPCKTAIKTYQVAVENDEVFVVTEASSEN